MATQSDLRRTAPGISAVLIAALLSLSAPLCLASDDWVLTDRFKSQLKDAQNGDALAMYEVGRMYERGRGTEQDMTKAAAWFQKSADKGQQEARARLGILYYDGLGLPKNVNKAAELLVTAANAGVSSAQFYLAQMYEAGDGMPQDSQKAMQWYQAAADGGYYQAKGRMRELAQTPITTRKPARKPKPPVQTATPAAAKEEKVIEEPAAPQRDKPGEALLRAVMQGNWLNKDQPASFLPSRTTICEKDGELSVKCLSSEQQRNTGAAVITYILEATLSGFNASDQFTVQYVNNVLKTTAVKTAANPDGNQGLAFNVKLGKQTTVHKLNCELEEENKLVCVKDKIATITYTR